MNVYTQLGETHFDRKGERNTNNKPNEQNPILTTNNTTQTEEILLDQLLHIGSLMLRNISYPPNFYLVPLKTKVIVIKIPGTTKHAASITKNLFRSQTSIR